MAQFTAEVYQNEFLPEDGTDVHAIVTITCTGAGEAGRGEGGDAAEIVIVDTSGSMQGERFANAQQAAAAAIDQILDGTWFAVIAGTDQAARAFPYPNAISPMVRMEPAAREEAKRAVRQLLAGGGTAMGTWLRLATQLFLAVPAATQRHAILLTDGKNQSESPRMLQDGDPPGAGRVPVRLPRRRRRLGRARAARSRHRPARHGRPRARARAAGVRRSRSSCATR